MKTVAVLYATREGHTKRIAEAVASRLSARGLEVELIELGPQAPVADLRRYKAAVIASPVHAGRHAPEVSAFVKEHRRELDTLPTAFVSVTLSQAGVQRRDAPPEQHAIFIADVAEVNERFFAQTGWRPGHVENVAGALAYTHYSFLIRFVMKRIARKSGGSTDTSRDHDYTDWAALDRFVAAFAETIGSGEAREAIHGT